MLLRGWHRARIGGLCLWVGGFLLACLRISELGASFVLQMGVITNLVSVGLDYRLAIAGRLSMLSGMLVRTGNRVFGCL